MTTRVQKGGPVFRPVAKSRSRPAVGDIRQPSIAPDSHDTLGIIASTTASLTSARPPEFAPSNAPHLQEPSDSPSPLQIVNPNVVAPASVPSHASSFANFQPAIPSLVSNTSSSNRGALRPPQNQPVPVYTDTRTSPQTQLTFPFLSPAIMPPSHLLDQSFASDSRMGLSSPQGYVVHNETENTPDPSTAGVVAEPFRIAAATSALIEAQPSGADPLKKSTRRKSSREESTELSRQTKRKHKTTLGSDPEGSNEETGTPANKPKRRAASGTPRVRKPSLPPFDADADPGEEIDPTVVTMASLCDDTGQGRVSRKAVEILENHAAWKAQNREKRARMKTLMEQKKYGREEGGDVDADQIHSNPGEAGPSAQVPPKPSNLAASTHLDDFGDGFDYSQDLATSRFNVQVRIGPNGETIIDEQSLVVDRAEAEDTENYTHITESDHTKFVNSGSYGKRFRGSRWSAEETESFYEALSQYGENYELIAYVLPGRDRKSCKNKFKAEDKKNPARINYCLRNTIPVDMETLSRMTGKDFSGPVPEIRVPTPPRPNIEVNNAAADEDERPAPRAPKRSRNKKNDEGVVIIGEVGGVEDQ